MKSMPIFTGLTQLEMTTNPECCPLCPTHTPTLTPLLHPLLPHALLPFSYHTHIRASPFILPPLSLPLQYLPPLTVLLDLKVSKRHRFADEGLADRRRKRAGRERDETATGSGSGHHLSKTQCPVQNTE